jgi:hypothetical protein
VVEGVRVAHCIVIRRDTWKDTECLKQHYMTTTTTVCGGRGQRGAHSLTQVHCQITAEC